MSKTMINNGNKATKGEITRGNYVIPSVSYLDGFSLDTASASLLRLQASHFEQEAKALAQSGKEALQTAMLPFTQWGEGCGKLENESDEEFAGRSVELALANGARVSVPVSVAFSNAVQAVCVLIATGRVTTGSKFKALALDKKLVGASIAETSDTVTASHGQFVASLRVVGLDVNGRIQAVFELLCKAVDAAMAQDSERAFGITKTIAGKVNTTPDVVFDIVQLGIYGQHVRHLRKVATSLQEKAQAIQQGEVSTRMDSERVRTIHTATLRSQEAIAASAGH